MVNGGESYRWSFGPLSAWGQYRVKDHPYHAPQFTLFLPVLNHPFRQIHKTPDKVEPTRIQDREKIMPLITCNIKPSLICSLVLFGDSRRTFFKSEHFFKRTFFQVNISLFFNSCSSKVNFSFRFKLDPEIIVRV